MAPEMLGQPTSYLGLPVDVWALGAVAYEVCHGRHAFSSCTLDGLFDRIRRGVLLRLLLGRLHGFRE